MKKNICIISIGSNTDAISNIQKAHKLLIRAYPSIRFSLLKETAPINMQRNLANFYNQIARIETEQELEEIATALKIIERFCGRKPTDKEQEIIPIDIDLLAYGDTILKPLDFARYSQEIATL